MVKEKENWTGVKPAKRKRWCLVLTLGLDTYRTYSSHFWFSWNFVVFFIKLGFLKSALVLFTRELRIPKDFTQVLIGTDRS